MPPNKTLGILHGLGEHRIVKNPIWGNRKKYLFLRYATRPCGLLFTYSQSSTRQMTQPLVMPSLGVRSFRHLSYSLFWRSCQPFLFFVSCPYLALLLDILPFSTLTLCPLINDKRVFVLTIKSFFFFFQFIGGTGPTTLSPYDPFLLLLFHKAGAWVKGVLPG